MQHHQFCFDIDPLYRLPVNPGFIENNYSDIELILFIYV